MDKRQALIRDLARLFIKYDYEDWRIVVDMLRRGGSEYEPFVGAIETLANRASTVKAPAKRDRTTEVLKEVTASDPKRGEMLKGLFEQLRDKKVAPKNAELKEACMQVSNKEAIPQRREDLISFLISRLATLPEPSFEAAVRAIPIGDRNLKDEYHRWFDMIYPSAR